MNYLWEYKVKNLYTPEQLKWMWNKAVKKKGLNNVLRELSDKLVLHTTPRKQAKIECLLK